MQPESNDEHLWVTWDSYHRSIEKLALMVHDSGWKFDQVLCLARGGLRPGDVFSRIFDVPLAILSTSSYREEAGTVRGDLDIAKYMTMTKGNLGGRVLLVDDLVDSGVTLDRVQKHLREHFLAVTEVKSASDLVQGLLLNQARFLPRIPAYQSRGSISRLKNMMACARISLRAG